MTTSDIERRALDLVEREEAQAARDKERRDRVAAEDRVADARRRIKENDAEIERERRRREAGAEADEFARERYALELKMEDQAAALNRSIEELRDLDGRHRSALHRAGRPADRLTSLFQFVPDWFRSRFGGGLGNLTGVHGSEGRNGDVPLPERDPLSRERV